MPEALECSPGEDASDDESWRAGLDIELNWDGLRTCLGRTRHYGPLRLQRPFFPEGFELTHLYILHPPGGLVTGDVLRQSIVVHAGASGLVTTPAAGKVYFCQSGRCQQQIVDVQVADGGSLEWLPQETILFDGCRADLKTRISLEGKASYIGWDIVCLGRQASGETFEKGSLLQTLSLHRDGKPLFRERLQLHPGDSRQSSMLGLGGCRVFGTMVATVWKEPDIPGWHERLEAHNFGNVAALTSRGGIFVVRYLGDSSAQARALFELVWRWCRPLVSGREACRPRIWDT